jgi:hypothetical protein
VVAKKGDGLQVKESTDSSTTLEDDDVKGEFTQSIYYFFTHFLYLFHFVFHIIFNFF